MEKLAKDHMFKKISGAAVYPSNRASWRVPFGTGQRVNRFLQGKQNEYLLYSPESFVVLKKWLEIFNSREILSGKEYLKMSKKINPALHEFLVINSFEANWKMILGNSKSDEQINKQKHYWFDGFKTLKLIHHLRDTVFPAENMFDADTQ